MKNPFHRIIDALRAEMAEYGGLLDLFQQQQESVLRHDPEGFLTLNESVESTLTTIGQRRSERENLVRETAASLGLNADEPLTTVIPHAPSELQPLLTALVREINDLLQRTQRRCRQNHLLLGHCLDLARQMVAVTNPQSHTGAYNARGQHATTPGVHALKGVAA